MTQQNFVVVGGSRGIGLGIVRRLLGRGGRVTVLSRSSQELENLPNVDHVSIDVTKDSISSDQLPEIVDGLVYCPGSINLGPIRSLDCDSLVDDFQLNVVGAVKVIQSALGALKRSDAASIVLFSSVAVGQGMAMHASVAVTKGGIEGLTRTLAAELAPRIRVNCVAPSLIDTSLAERFLNTPEKRTAMASKHPLKRIGSVDDIAASVDFLLSLDAAWITGQVIGVDGGLSRL